MGKRNKQRIVELRITEFSKQGNGLSWFEDAGDTPFQVEIPFTVPGDVVRAKLARKYNGIYRAVLIEILTPSPDRKPARCIHFGSCGGCRYQQISYEHQLKLKDAYVRQCFADVSLSDVHFLPILSCDDPWNYRNKMEFTFAQDLMGNKRLGLIKEGTTGTVFDLTECHLVNHWFIDAVKTVKNWWMESGILPYWHNKGTLQSLVLRDGQRSGDRMIVLTVSGNPEWALQAKQIESFVSAVKAALEPSNPASQFSIFLRIKQAEVGMTTSIYDMLLYGSGLVKETLDIQVYPEEAPVPLSFNLGPADFFQPNPRQTERFYSMALKISQIPRDAVVYDLYCGAGTLGLCISKFVKQVIGIEFWPESAANARNNAKRNGCNNVTIFSGAVRHTLHQLPEHKIPRPDVVMVNPPRSGLDPEALHHLLELSPPKILYISCNPATQASNVAHLQRNGYRLVTVQPVDQFPQTNQIECITVLTKQH